MCLSGCVEHVWHFMSACLLSLSPTDLEAGGVGLALSYAITLVGMFQWGVRQCAEVENMVRTTRALDPLGFDRSK